MISSFRSFKYSQEVKKLLGISDDVLDNTCIKFVHYSNTATKIESLHYAIYNGRNKDVIVTNTIDNYEYKKLFPFSTGGRKYKELQYAPKLKHKLVHVSESMEIINLFN